MSSNLHDLAAPYALDALDDFERLRFEAHLESCDECRDEVAGFCATAMRLGGAQSETPPPDLRAKIMAQAATTRQERPIAVVPSRVRLFLPRVAVAAALFVGAAGGIGFLVEHDRAGQVQDQNVAMSTVLGAPDAQTVTKALGGDAVVRMVTSATNDAAVVVARKLPSPGEGKVYQVWMVTDGDSHSEGTFSTDGTMVMRGVGKAQEIAVTVEPEGGSPKPTSDPVLSMDV